MKKVTYINAMPYQFDKNHKVAHYLLTNGKYRNHGEFLESVVKYHLGIFTDVNPNTTWSNGSDIEMFHISVKSDGACIGRNFGDIHDPNKQIAFYFRYVPSSTFVWPIMNEKTQEVTEYHMSKREFGKFVNLFTYYTSDSKMKDKAIRFRSSTKKMKKWLDEQCAA